jgi:putative Holliday junction resolvase
MISDPLQEFLYKTGFNGALMGLDLGTKTIGVAVSDLRQTVATGIETIKRTKFQQDLKKLKLIMDDRDIKGIVLGLPKNMNGTEGPRCQSTRAFGKNVSVAISTPITFWDERLSTVAAERSLIEANTSRLRRAEVIDYVAASFILQGALDRLAVLKKGFDLER